VTADRRRNVRRLSFRALLTWYLLVQGICYSCIE
jgi:hypothetical protein